MSAGTRSRACELAVGAAQHFNEVDLETLWSLCVFFENYLDGGADATRDDFGPKFPEATVVPMKRAND